MGARSTAAAAACSLVVLAVTAIPATAQHELSAVDASGDLVVAAFGVHEDRLELRVARGERSWNPADVVLRTPPDATSTVPDDPGYSFLGAAGRRTWLLASPTGIRPSWDTTALVSEVAWELTGTTGPGRFTAFTTAPDGTPELLFDSSDDKPDARTMPAGSRGRVTWAFSEPGRYDLRFSASTPLAAGGEATTETTYHVEVVPGAFPELPIAPPSSRASTTTTTTPPSTTVEVVQTPREAPHARPEALEQAASNVLAEGHVDVAGRLVDGALRLEIGDESTGSHRWLEPCEVVFHVRPAGRIEVPDDPNFAFLGDPGAPVWVLSQEQQAGLLWPGWNTEEIPAAEITGPVEWTLSSVDGPGQFWLFVVGALGEADVFFDSGDGVPDALDVPAGTHAHGNWAFQQEGVYRLGFEMSVTKTSGETVSDEVTLAVAVGETDPAGVTPGPCDSPDPTTTTTTTTTAITTTTTTATTTTTSRGLASTGASLRPPLLGVGGVLLLVGVALLAVTRRRNRAGR